MKKLIILIGVICLCFGAFAQGIESPGQNEDEALRNKQRMQQVRLGGTEDTDKWAWVIGGDSYDFISRIEEAPDGSLYAAGWSRSFSEAINPGYGIPNGWMLKLSREGKIIWEAQYGGDRPDLINSLAITPDGGCLVGGHGQSFGAQGHASLVFKVSPFDSQIENQVMLDSTAFDSILNMDYTRDGGCILCGKTLFFNPTNFDVWVAKISADFKIEWKKGFESLNTDVIFYDIKQTLDGGYLAAGFVSYSRGIPPKKVILLIKFDASGEIEWSKAYRNGEGDVPTVRSLCIKSDGGYAVGGVTKNSGAGGQDIWLLELFPDGEIQSQKTYGGPGSDFTESISRTSDGGYLLSGATNSFGAAMLSYFMIKLTPALEIEWQKAYGGTLREYAYDSRETLDGGYVVIGTTLSFGDEGGDILVIKTDSTGNTNPPELAHPTNFIVGDSFAEPEEFFIPLGNYALHRKPGYLEPSETNSIHFAPNVSIIFPPIDVRLQREINQSLSAIEAFNVVRWKRNPTNRDIEVKEYKVYRKKLPVDEYYTHVDTISASGSSDSFSYTDSHLSLSVKYRYMIIAVKSDGTESWISDEVSNQHEE